MNKSCRRLGNVALVVGVTFGALTLSPAAQADVAPAATIAEIQGSGAASPLLGQTVTTKGVVTAAYPTGGFNGYVIQTPGTGGAIDLMTHTASDGLFVYSSATVADAHVGDFVQVSGVVSEFGGRTEIDVPAAGLTALTDAHDAVTAATTTGWPGTDAQRESLESMLYRPTGDFTVTNTFATNQYGEVGLAAGDTPLIQWTDVAAPGSAAAAAVKADNAARAVTLDDGASTNFLAASSKELTPPYISMSSPVRVTEQVSFTKDVVVDYRNGAWKFEPTAEVTAADPAGYPAGFANNRAATPNATSIGAADIRVTSFNVQNYFTLLGENVAGCTSYKDREGNPITVNSCPGNGPRGAWNAENLARQQQKIVTAINASGADVAGLEEIENSVVVGEAKDHSLATLVDALNAAAGPGTWAYVPSNTGELPPTAQMDVINCAIIYRPAKVSPVGASHALGTQSVDGTTANSAFANAREPIAQTFQPKTAGDSFLFVVNHFKSKSSAGPWADDADTGDGQGASNGSRKRQAQALADWVPTLLTGTGTKAVVMVGDYNSYTQEDPLQILYGAGYSDAETALKVGKYSYSFSGLSGSLDHVLLNDAALGRATGADTWNINSGESIALNYSRYNYHATSFWDGTQPYAASDHDPVVVGLTAAAPSSTQTVQILGINDFHGRIASNGVEAGAAVLAGAVTQLRAEHPDTVFAAAGDLIGASTFESFIAKDKPTIDALNQAGLQVSAVGNHEFDQGYGDLVNRVMAPYDATSNPFGGAKWQYLGANVRNSADNSPALPESWVQNFGTIKVGFVGAVTDHLPELVSPAGIAGLTIEAPVVAANREADKLKAAGADIVVLLVHEGAATPELAASTDPTSDFGKIVTGADENIDAIVSGHTHLTYNHSIPVPAWAAEGRPVTSRPVVSAGQYGYNLDQLLFDVDSGTGEVLGVQSKTLPLVTSTTTGGTTTFTPNYPADAATAAIVKAAIDQASVLGQQPLGQLGGPFNRAKLANGTTENRGGESTLGNLVAEVQKWATSSSTAGSAQIALMNPGGLRADLVGSAGTPATYPATLTYQQAATVQPFANTLVNVKLTGAQLKTVLEQQWQPAGAARPFLKLGLSKGFSYTYDPAASTGSHITRMELNGSPIDPATSYSVTVNSFLAAGGDNFLELANGTAKHDTGQTDLQAMVDYLAEHTPVPVDYTQRAVGISFPAGAPAGYQPGDTVSFALSSLAFATAADLKDSQVSLLLDETAVGSAAVDNTIGTDIFDEYGKASVSFEIPAGTAPGGHTLTITGDKTGTTLTVPLTVTAPPQVATTTTLAASRSEQVFGWPFPVLLTATVHAADGSVVTGEVEFRSGDRVLGTVPVREGVASYPLPTNTPGGQLTVIAVYDGTSKLAGSTSAPVVVQIDRAPSLTLLASTGSTQRYGRSAVTVIALPVVPFVADNSGAVVFRDGATVLATVPVRGGLAAYTLSRTLPVGSHRLTATFSPANPGNVAPSTSNPVTVVVRP